MSASARLAWAAVIVLGAGAYLWLAGAEVSPAGSSGQNPADASEPATPAGSPGSSPPSAMVQVPDAVPAVVEQGGELARQMQATHELLARMEKAWAEDLPDPVGAADLEERLVKSLGAARIAEVRDQPLRLLALGCRATICRIEAAFPGGAGASEWSTRLLMESGGGFASSRMLMLPGADGESRVVVYAIRAAKH